MSGEPRVGRDENAANLRLFFAVPLAEELRDRAVELQRELSRSARDARVKWVERENLHLTLKFVGDTPAGRLDELIAIARQVAGEAKSCELHYRGVGFFAGRGLPRTIWLGLAHEAPELTALAKALDEALARAGLAEGARRPFRGHLTLGRVKDARGSKGLVRAIGELAEAPVGTQRMRDFTLISSELTGTGPIYTERAVFGLVD